MTAVNLALGGGGVKGLAHIGVMKALVESKIEIKMVSGVSAGALMGAGFCALANGYDPLEVILYLETRVLREDLGAFKDIKIGPGLFKGDKLREFMFEITHRRQFGNIRIPFICTALDCESKEPILFSPSNTPEIFLADAARASAGIPEVFAPFKLKVLGRDRLLWDGGIIGNIRPDLVSTHIPTFIVSLSGIIDSEPKRPPFYWFGFNPKYWLWMIGQVTGASIDALDRLRVDCSDNDTIIRPNTKGLSAVDFDIDRKTKLELIANGYRAGMRAIEEITK